MKVIFLDIDGVLNTSETYNKLYSKFGCISGVDIEIDEFRLKYLKSIIDKTDAKIVLSSSFRHFFMKENDVIVPRTLKGERTYNLFMNNGIEIYDITPITSDSRENQIKAWLSERDDVDDFVIIDDEPSMFDELLDKLVQTSKVKRNYMLMDMDSCFGLCERHIYIIVDMLNGKNKVLKK